MRIIYTYSKSSQPKNEICLYDTEVMNIQSVKIKLLSYSLLTIGVILSAVNLYGLTQNIRPEGLFNSDMRFKNDITISYEELMSSIDKKEGESQERYAERLTSVIANGIAHIHWHDEADTRRFNQLIPVWENYFLYVMGLLSGIPEYEKYHFADYKRSLTRGIGICGDASMIMSQLLSEYGITNQIISFPGHVVVTAQYPNGREELYDPDYGVYIPYSLSEVTMSTGKAAHRYSIYGYPESDINFFLQEYSKEYQRWDSVSHFIMKKYYFEKVAYMLKWPLPIVLMIISGWIMLCRNGK